MSGSKKQNIAKFESCSGSVRLHFNFVKEKKLIGCSAGSGWAVRLKQFKRIRRSKVFFFK